MQLAKLDGITAIGTTSNDQKKVYAENSGAQFILNRNTEDIEKRVLELTSGVGVDLVLDHVGGKEFVSNLAYLAPLGVLQSYNIMGGLPDENLLEAMRSMGAISPAIRCFTIHTLDSVPLVRRALMQRAINLAAENKISPPSSNLFSLSEAVKAHELLDSANFFGKIVLIP